MPKWNCPVCGASHTVPQSKIGQLGNCKKCGKSSVIEDPDQQSPLAGIGVAPLQPAQGNWGYITPDVSKLTRPAKYLWVAMICICGAIGAFLLSADKPSASVWITIAVAGALQAVLFWPFYTLVEDTRENKILLEEILRNQKP